MKPAEFSILIADDERDIIASVAEHITQLSRRFKQTVHIHSASSAIEVLDVLGSQDVDALLLDYHFEGGMNGDEIMDTMSDPFGQKLIILMSGRPPKELEQLVIKRHKKLGGRFRFLRKPFETLELQEMYLQVLDFLGNRPYPCPLAYTHQVMTGATTAHDRLRSLKDVVESLISYSVGVFTADCKRLGCLPAMKVKLANGPITLGAWLRWLTTAHSCIASQSGEPFMPELLQLFSDTTGGASAVKLLYEFKNEVRDTELAHWFAREEDWYDRIVERYAGEIQSMFDGFVFTTRYPLLTVETIDLPRCLATFRYSVRSLMGVSGPFPVNSIDTQERLTKGEVFAYRPRGTFLCLHPVIRFEMCGKCSVRRFFFLEQAAPSKFTYRAHCNHLLERERPGGNQDTWFSELPVALFSSA